MKLLVLFPGVNPNRPATCEVFASFEITGFSASLNFEVSEKDLSKLTCGAERRKLPEGFAVRWQGIEHHWTKENDLSYTTAGEITATNATRKGEVGAVVIFLENIPAETPVVLFYE